GGFKIIGESIYDEAGSWSMSSLGDINGDGIPDLLVAAPGNDAGGAESGAAYVVFGKTDGSPVDLGLVAAGTGGFKVIGEHAGDRAGNWVSGYGDVNGDSRLDMLVGAPFNDGPNLVSVTVAQYTSGVAVVGTDVVTLADVGTAIAGL